MSEHSCAYCRIARIMNIAQINRFTESGKSPEDFLNDPYEDQISSDVTMLMIDHDRLKSKENRPVR
jgi:hypothetical protein